MIARSLVTTLLVSAAALSPPAAAQDLGIDVGARAPAVTVQSLDGKRVDLGNFIGKTPMLIEFWA
ncbi:MAG: TlpA family protein disulfide reductase, partial [Gemmatimonadaceae bacterium]